MKTAELDGAALDYYVAKAEGLDIEAIRNGAVIIGRTPNRYAYAPSSKWETGGPLIEREGMRLSRTSGRPEWHALTQGNREENCMNFHMGYGRTPLIAAMRAFVASKFGDEVPDIKEKA